jgi:DNA-binding NarL/FixJ family response regulator
VRNNVSNILAKLNLADRTQAALRAREAGLRRS